MSEPLPEVEQWRIVQPEQINGRSQACVNCQAKLGERHNVMCYAQAIARQAARRASDNGEQGGQADG